MKYNWYDLVGNIGVAIILITYLLLQMNKFTSGNPMHSLLNAIGALLIITSLVYNFNLSAFLVELFWLLISIYGIVTVYVDRRQSIQNSKCPTGRD
jgi:CDP-diglyceride synthetase